MAIDDVCLVFHLTHVCIPHQLITTSLHWSLLGTDKMYLAKTLLHRMTECWKGLDWLDVNISGWEVLEDCFCLCAASGQWMDLEALSIIPASGNWNFTEIRLLLALQWIVTMAQWLNICLQGNFILWCLLLGHSLEPYYCLSRWPKSTLISCCCIVQIGLRCHIRFILCHDNGCITMQHQIIRPLK